MGYSVNSGAALGARIERSLRGKLVEILRGVGWLGEVRVRETRLSTSDGADAIVHVGLAKGRRVDLHVHVKKELRPGGFSAWAELRRGPSKQKGVSILAMPFVSERLAELCKQAGWSWYDLAGNCWIDLPGLLHVERRGIPPMERPPRSGANLGTAAAARVLRALLRPGNAGRTWTQRDLQAKTVWRSGNGENLVSLGLVNKVVRHLHDEGFVGDMDGHGIKVRDPIGLLATWNKAYRFDVHERRSYFSLLKGAQLHEALNRVASDACGMAAYAAFSAAERQAPHVRQPNTWLYVAPAFLDLVIEHTEAKEVDSGENLVVLVAADVGVFVSLDRDSHGEKHALGCTEPVQTYVDLTHCGGRGEEAAQALLEQKILPAWKSVAAT
jgi:hypothetical protein